MKQADLFVLPSRYEGFGIAVVEAMACGLPVIATDCPSGPAEILRHGEDGILVPPEDVDALATALAELMADQGKRRSLGSRGIEAARRFDLDLVSQSWDELLEAVVTARDRA
jgi:glycosyltransferase involved in cell wall biosynthesis